MAHTHISALAGSIWLGLFGLFIACMVIQHKTVERWMRDTGRAPMIHKGRGSWHKYLRLVEHEMPAPLRKRIAIWKWVGYSSMMLLPVVMLIDALCHR